MGLKVVCTEVCLVSALKPMAIIAALEVANEVVHWDILDRSSDAHNVLENLAEGVFFSLIVRVGACTSRILVEASKVERRFLKLVARSQIEFSLIHLNNLA